ncbi:hypothetical protein OH82_00225 [Azospirillum brasilense]|nr:hypothetical protein OH82_00225 [Azospirillum brasilense]
MPRCGDAWPITLGASDARMVDLFGRRLSAVQPPHLLAADRTAQRDALASTHSDAVARCRHSALAHPAPALVASADPRNSGHPVGVVGLELSMGALRHHKLGRILCGTVLRASGRPAGCDRGPASLVALLGRTSAHRVCAVPLCACPAPARRTPRRSFPARSRGLRHHTGPDRNRDHRSGYDGGRTMVVVAPCRADGMVRRQLGDIAQHGGIRTMGASGSGSDCPRSGRTSTPSPPGADGASLTDEVGTATDLLPRSDRIKTHRLIRSLPFPCRLGARCLAHPSPDRRFATGRRRGGAQAAPITVGFSRSLAAQRLG